MTVYKKTSWLLKWVMNREQEAKNDNKNHDGQTEVHVKSAKAQQFLF